jgi:hypothetical protein
MIIRVAVRSLVVRPLRTAVLAAGFGLGIAVMAELLGVGGVILEQAHSPALRGGGDVVVSGAFGPLNSARFILSNVLGGRDLRDRIAAASPSRRATLYLIKDGDALPVFVRGGIPSLERAVGDQEIASAPEWTDAPADRAWSAPDQPGMLRAMDRFHAVPTAAPTSSTAEVPTVSAHSWAEWLYFNGRSPDGRLRLYLTFLAGAPTLAGTRPAFVRLQLDRDGRSENYSAAAEIDHALLLQQAPDLDVGGNRVRLDGLRYRVTLALTRESEARRSGTVGQPAAPPRLMPRPGRAASGSPAHVTGELTLDAIPGRSVPPAAIQGARGWVSGYVVPVLAGVMNGALVIDGQRVPLDHLAGYHDHNWGFWEGVRWQWGQAAHGDLSIVYGRVFPPPDVADPERIPGFLGVLGPSGPIAFSTNVGIEETDDHGTPRALTVVARGDHLDVRLALTIEESVRTRMQLTKDAGGAALDFLQLGGVYHVTGHAGTRDLTFTTRGSAETFRPGR